MASKKVLKEIADSVNGTPGYYMLPTAEAAKLANDGLVLSNPAIVEHGKIAVRPTDKLIAQFSDASASSETAAAKPQFEIVDMVPLPAPGKRGGIKEEVYPFSKLEIGQSFVVPATEENAHPEESFASTVSSANRRFAIETGETTTKTGKDGQPKTVKVLQFTRKFTLRPVTAGQKYDNGFVEPTTGARVFRIA